MRISPVSDRGLVRLIPATYHKPPTLRGLVDTDDELEVLAQLEGLTSARLTAERGGNTHLDRRELAFARRARDLQVYGNTHINLTPTSNASAHNIVGVTHTIEYGALTLRANVATAVLNTDILRQFFDGFRQFGPQGAAIADKYDILDKRIDLRSIGFNYDPGKWFVTAEGGTSNGHSFIGKSRGMFISGGYRAGEFTPYATYSRNDAQSPISDPGLSTAGLPPAYAYAAMQLNYGLDQTLKTRSSQTSTIAGVRWDFRTDMALKLQYERVLPRNGSRGTLANLQPGFVSGRAVHVTSAVLDFVF